jgi:Xaa-Pro aminopeptidase
LNVGSATAFETAEFKARVARIQTRMRDRGADVLIADTSETIAYYCGYDSSATMYRALVIPAAGEPVMILRELDETPYLELSWLSEYVIFRDWDDPIVITANYLHGQGYATRTIAVDLQSYVLTVARFQAYQTLLPKARFVDMSDDLMQAPLVKSQAEIEYLRKAAQIADAVMHETIEWAQEGVSPRDVVGFASAGFFKHGADHGPIGPITAGTGENFLHGLAHRRPLQRGEILHVELIPKYRGYSSRMMRSIIMGAPTDQQNAIVEKLIELQDRQFAAIRPGVIAREVDAICRQGAIEAGLRTTYHNLSGYTVGYYPNPAIRSSNFYRALHPEADWPLEAGMLFHAYVSAQGLALSETILVTETGCERLTQTERKLFSKETGSTLPSQLATS